MHKAVLFVCIAGTAALLAGGAFFASYYFSNQDKLFIADIDYRYEPGRGPARPLFHISYEQSMLLTREFKWGGCAAQQHNKLNDTFRLHCWGLARDIRSLKEEIDSTPAAPALPVNPELRQAVKNAPPALYTTHFNQHPLTAQKKFLTLLAAFSYHKLHLDIAAPPDATKQSGQQ